MDNNYSLYDLDTTIKGLGALPSPHDVRDYVLSKRCLEEDTEIPDKLDLGILIIKDQGTKDTCAAHAMSEIIEYHNKKETGETVQFSTTFLYGCRNVDGETSDYVGEGMYLRDVCTIAQKYGDVILDKLPGNYSVSDSMYLVNKNLDLLREEAHENRISTYFKINSNDELKYALYKYGPVIAGMKWYDRCGVDKQGRLFYNARHRYGGHAVMIVGWDENGFIVQNSWGTSWGNNGRFYISYSEAMNELIFEAYGVTDDVVNLKKPFKNSKNVAKFINLIINRLSILERKLK